LSFVYILSLGKCRTGVALPRGGSGHCSQLLKRFSRRVELELRSIASASESSLYTSPPAPPSPLCSPVLCWSALSLARSVLLVRAVITTAQLSRRLLFLDRFGRNALLWLFLTSFGGHSGASQRPRARPKRRERTVNVVSCSLTFGLMFARAGEERSTGGAPSCCWGAAGCAVFLHSQWTGGTGFFNSRSSITLRFQLFFIHMSLPLHIHDPFLDASERSLSAFCRAYDRWLHLLEPAVFC
jgi:hypothetical protein